MGVNVQFAFALTRESSAYTESQFGRRKGAAEIPQQATGWSGRHPPWSFGRPRGSQLARLSPSPGTLAFRSSRRRPTLCYPPGPSWSESITIQINDRRQIENADQLLPGQLAAVPGGSPCCGPLGEHRPDDPRADRASAALRHQRHRDGVLLRACGQGSVRSHADPAWRSARPSRVRPTSPSPR